MNSKKYLEAKLKSFEGKKNTYFPDNTKLKEEPHCSFMSIILYLILFLKLVKTIIHKCFRRIQMSKKDK